MTIQPDEGDRTTEGWTGISGRINPQYSHPVFTHLSVHTTINISQGIMGYSSMKNHAHREIINGKFLNGNG